MPEDTERKEFSKQIQHGLLVVAGTSVGCAILHVFFPDRFDDKTAMFLVVAIVALVIQQVTKFKGFGLEFEKEVSQLKEDMKNVETAVGDLEKGVGQGSKAASAALAKKPPALTRAAEAGAPTVDPNDPNKGQFGGKPEQGGRQISAKIVPDAGPKSARCRVSIKVVSTDPSRPLTGKVKLHLHPTFGQWSSYDLTVRGGVAEDEIVSYGAFTIGAETDDGKSRLELDLVDVPGGTTRFYLQ